jgi:hypothetical protein
LGGRAEAGRYALSGQGLAPLFSRRRRLRNFDFDPTHLYVDQSTPEQKAKTAVWDRNHRFVYSDPRFAQNMGVSSAVETTIPDGAKS